MLFDINAVRLKDGILSLSRVGLYTVVSASPAIPLCFHSRACHLDMRHGRKIEMPACSLLSCTGCLGRQETEAALEFCLL